MTDKGREFIAGCKKLTEENMWKMAEFLTKLKEVQEDENERRTNADEQRRIG